MVQSELNYIHQFKGYTIRGGSKTYQFFKKMLGFHKSKPPKLELGPIRWVSNRIQIEFLEGNDSVFTLHILSRRDASQFNKTTEHLGFTFTMNAENFDPTPLYTNFAVFFERLKKHTLGALLIFIMQDRGKLFETVDDVNQIYHRSITEFWAQDGQWYNFLCSYEIVDRGFDRIAYENTMVISHVDQECIFRPSPNKDHRTLVDTPAQALPQLSNGDGITTNLKDEDIITGKSQDKLSQALDFSIAQNRDAIMLTCSCLPITIGDKIGDIVAEKQEETSAPIMYIRSTPFQENPFYQMESHLRKVVRTTAVQEKPRLQHAYAINWLGVNKNATDVKELASVLENIGIGINRYLIPAIDLQTIHAFPFADFSIYSDNKLFNKAFYALEDMFPGHTRMIHPPYGIQGTLQWLNEIIHALPDISVSTASQEPFTSWVSKSPVNKEVASSYYIGFILDINTVHILMNPGIFYGIPVLSMLQEMGFGIAIFIYSPSKFLFSQLQEQLREDLHTYPHCMIHRFETQEQLDRLMRMNALRLVYSEIVHDSRVINLGKMVLSANDLEMGYHGFLRSYQRILQKAELELCTDYGEYCGYA